MLTLNSPQIIHQKVSQWKSEGYRIHLVPTMGCLHRGHLALVEKAKAENTKVLVSIFVNPLQFGKNEDFDKYPRTLEDDAKLLEDAGVDCLFAPRVADLYPEGFSTKVSVSGLTEHLCGKSRPGHFEGVTTVCLKLFQITQADLAVFGEKDFQQLRVLEQMVEDLNLAVRLLPHEIVREDDGLALSSRNRYLSKDERLLAAAIPKALLKAVERAQLNSATTVAELLDEVRSQLKQVEIDYLAIASSLNLVPAEPHIELSEIKTPRIFIAAKVGATRLIDNMPLNPLENS